MEPGLNNEQENKNRFFSWISSLFSCKKEKNKIINKKTFEYQEEKRSRNFSLFDDIKAVKSLPKEKCCCCCCCREIEPLEFENKSIKINNNNEDSYQFNNVIDLSCNENCCDSFDSDSSSSRRSMLAVA